jgi:hypothetical protein
MATALPTAADLRAALARADVAVYRIAPPSVCIRIG